MTILHSHLNGYSLSLYWNIQKEIDFIFKIEFCIRVYLYKGDSNCIQSSEDIIHFINMFYFSVSIPTTKIELHYREVTI